ncbi:Hsp33 family molecular chaperone HslO [Deinococcus peraridilitoris]|uniref:33 kDa chaperonin n=1 Tax=Deinococcus peraridilitoris (strain DSM 19664 / LMG 22246 / CIP 109416 / KR-200) TaxID=937777 RepID=K9ZX21_DEIPD|nr:Hsp33 family molecular chaperone HslO [Deinococcus peraridilitoris]AFZ66106.1 disulfide bond chaperone [Deinococcus peraridilitoris DSM 19664]
MKQASFLLRGTAAQDTLRVLAVDATAVVEEARARHDLSATASAALGRTLAGALLLAQVLGKTDNARVTIRIQGDGPIGWIVAEGSADGGVRGYVRNPHAELPPRESDGKLDVRGVIGSGDLGVMRLLENAEPYTGTVELVSGEIAEDLTYYLARSEQINSAVLLGVYVEGGHVAHAGGLIVQAMPGVTNETLARIEGNIASMGSITDNLRRGSLLETVQQATEGLDLVLQSNAQPVTFACRCSEQRALASLTYFNPSERQEMIDEGGQEVVCHWCGHRYHLSPEQIQALDTPSAQA